MAAKATAGWLNHCEQRSILACYEEKKKEGASTLFFFSWGWKTSKGNRQKCPLTSKMRTQRKGTLHLRTYKGRKKKELGKPAVFFHFNIERPHGARKKKTVRKEERKGKGNAEEDIQR